MPEIQVGFHTIQSHGLKVARIHLRDWLILVLLAVLELVLYIINPFHSLVQKEWMTDLKYPMQGITVPFWAVPMIAVMLLILMFVLYYLYRRDVYDVHHAIIGLLFFVLITGVISDAIKDAVGRPQADFFWHCFPDGRPSYDRVTGDVLCHGEKSIIKEGYKSFPSGHTSWSFAGLGFLSWYLSGKIRAFDSRGHVAKLSIVFLPLLTATLIGISVVNDYWHHWQDVLVRVFLGGLFGFLGGLQRPCLAPLSGRDDQRHKRPLLSQFNHNLQLQMVGDRMHIPGCWKSRSAVHHSHKPPAFPSTQQK